MSAVLLLSRVNGVKCIGVNRWIARCPAHDDRRPSLSIGETDDGRLLVHCFAGCSVQEVAGAVGLDLAYLFPKRTDGHFIKSVRRPFPAIDVLRCVAFEALVCAVAASSLAKGSELSESDRARLFVAAQRLQAAAEACRA
jgi:hypothetical protein